MLVPSTRFEEFQCQVTTAEETFLDKTPYSLVNTDCSEEVSASFLRVQMAKRKHM
jgi:hypothetical protein